MKTFKEWIKEKAELRDTRPADIKEEFIRKLECILNVDYWTQTRFKDFIRRDNKRKAEESEHYYNEIEKKIEKNRKMYMKLEKEISDRMNNEGLCNDIIMQDTIEKKKLKIDYLNKSYFELENKFYSFVFDELDSLGVLSKEEVDLFDLVYELTMEKDNPSEKNNYSYIKKNEWEKIDITKREELLEALDNFFNLGRGVYFGNYFDDLERKIMKPQDFRILYILNEIMGYVNRWWDILEFNSQEYEKDLKRISRKMENAYRDYDKEETEKLKNESKEDKRKREEASYNELLEEFNELQIKTM